MISSTKVMVISLLLFGVCVNTKLFAQGGIITSIVGIGTAGFSGDNKPAKNAQLNVPSGLCLDKWGNLYIADGLNSRIRRVDNNGIITTVAGDGSFSYGGDGGPSMNAKLFIPEAVAPDTLGNIYITDAGNNRIRKITIASGIISTVAGNGNQGNAGDGGIAINAELNGASGVCLDKAGNIYIADYANNKIRKVTASTGIIKTIAGIDTGGYGGDGGLATKAKLSGPSQVNVDDIGNVYIADQGNSRVRKLNITTGIITTIAGTGISGYTGDNGLATNAQLGEPTGISIGKNGDIYINDYHFGVIRKISSLTGIITTVAGTGVRGYSGDGGLAVNAELRCGDLFLDPLGNIFIADYENNVIRKITSTVGINSLSEISNDFRIYPNPAKDFIIIANSNYSGNVEMELYDISGKRVMQESINIDHGGVKLPLNVPSGSYFLHLRTEHLDEHVERITITR